MQFFVFDDVTSNPHALDENTFLNKILTYFLCEKSNTKFPKNAEEKNTLFYENLTDIHKKATLICSNGQINLSTLVILDMLSENDCMLYYSGDYDPEGLLIADRLMERYKNKIEPVFYSVEIYLSIISDVKIDDRRLKQLDKIKDKRLIPIAECMKREKRSAYQEGLILNNNDVF